MWQMLSSLVHLGARLCADAVPHSPYEPMYAALVCGRDLPPGNEKGLFLDTGLIHIMVVSGTHLIFVERLVGWLPQRTRLGVSAAYVWLTGFGAPVVRAFVRRVCSHALSPWGWSLLQVEALASVAIVLIHPSWLHSRSFLMSWLCALAMQAPLPVRGPPELKLALKCYVFLFPFCPSSPLSIGWNCLLGPLIGEVLFPVCVAAFVCPWLVPACDFVWRALFWLLSAGPKAPAGLVWWPTAGIWWLPALVHGLLLWGEWKWRRAVAFSCF